MIARITSAAILIPQAEPPLAQPGAWAGYWRRMAVKSALADRRA